MLPTLVPEYAIQITVEIAAGLLHGDKLTNLMICAKSNNLQVGTEIKGTLQLNFVARLVMDE